MFCLEQPDQSGSNVSVKVSTIRVHSRTKSSINVIQKCAVLSSIEVFPQLCQFNDVKEEIKAVRKSGTRKNTGEIHPFKKGPFHVAVSGQLPILPVVFSPYFFLDDRQRTYDSGKVIISALPPIPTEGLTMDDVDGLMQKVRENMMEEFSKMSKEVKTDLMPPCSSPSLKCK